MAKWIAWFGNGIEDSPDIPGGLGKGRSIGSVEDIVSHHKDVHAAIRKYGMPIKHRADVNLQRVSKTGGLQVTWAYTTGGNYRTKLDYYVILHDTDDNAGDGYDGEKKGKAISAVSIEYGHMNKHPTTGKRTWVEGAWILHDAAGLPHK